MRHIQHRILKSSIRQQNPLHIQLVLAARATKVASSKELLIDNFCQRPGRIDMDH